MPLDDAPSSLINLINRHRDGDPAAVNAILTHCHERLKQLTRQMLRKFPIVHAAVETSDVFHDVVAKLIEALRQLPFDSPADFVQLAACQIRRRLIDLSRKHRPDLLPGPASDGFAPAADPPQTTDDPYKLAVWGEFHSRVAGLPDDERRLFDLLYYQGLTQPEAAELLGLPLRTLKRHWQRAREAVGRSLGNGTFL